MVIKHVPSLPHPQRASNRDSITRSITGVDPCRGLEKTRSNRTQNRDRDPLLIGLDGKLYYKWL